MTDNSEDLFLKAIRGAKPIKKNNKIEKPVPETKKNLQLNIKIKKHTPVLENKFIKKTFSENLKIEKSPINKKLKKGRIPIDKKIDFHGMSLFEAENLFHDTILDCYNNNLRCIHFVTGKGILRKNSQNNMPALYYGKIRNSFISWTQKTTLNKHILNVEEASLKHGADGAFLVYLRKNKT